MRRISVSLTPVMHSALTHLTSIERQKHPERTLTASDVLRTLVIQAAREHGFDVGPTSVAHPTRTSNTPRAPAPAPRASLHERLEAIARHEPVPAAAPAVESVYDRMLAKRDAFGPAFDPNKLPADEHEAYLEVFTPSGVKK